MINVTYHDGDAFGNVVFGEQHPANLAYFQKQIESVGAMVGQATNSFYQGAAALYERFNGSEAMRMARAAVRGVTSLFAPNVIQDILNMGAMQQAPVVMQRWIMAEPTVRTLYHKQECDGFSDTYKDMSPGIVGEQHYDYRRVMDGVIQEDGDSWCAKFYMDDLVEGDTPLIFRDKMDILSTWERVTMYIAAGDEDPTSTTADKL
jgi:hypothetical protein